MEQPADTDAASAAAAEAVAAGSNVEAAASSAGETLDASGSSNAALDGGETLPSGISSVEDAQNASSGSGQIDSDPTIEFTSQETQESSTQDSVSISQFSDESQSVLCNIYGSVIDQSNDDVGVLVLDEGQAPSLSGDTHDVENMDSSISLKRACEEEFTAPATPSRPSRPRSRSGDSRKKSRSDSSSCSLSARRHSGLSLLPPPLGGLEISYLFLVLFFLLL